MFQRDSAMTENASMSEDVTKPLDSEREEEIRKQAYALWREQGQPEGKDREHWLEAERARDGHGDRVSAPIAPGTGAQGVPEQGTVETSTPLA